jgi:CRP-like cAMP-binding protein/CheY-like chemotaxis protein
MVNIDRLRPLALFKFSSELFLSTFASISNLRTATAGTRILTQGQINDRLLVLLKGEAEVSVDDERVANLETGDLLGEISVLVGRPATASIQASTDVEFLELSAKDLDQTIKTSTTFGYELYRLLSAVLSEKIINTNQKARQFEIAGRELAETNRTLDEKVRERTQQLKKINLELETQNLEVLASHRKIEELYATKDVTFKRLIELQASLAPLLTSLKEIEGKVPGLSASIAPVNSRLHKSLEILKPITELYSSEQAIRSRKILIVEPEKKQQVLTRMALGGTGVRLEIAADLDEARGLIKNTRFDLIFVSSQLASAVGELQKLLPEARIVYVTSNDMRAELPALQSCSTHLSNIVSRNPEDRLFTIKNITTTISKLFGKDLFGLEKYMNLGVDVQKRAIKHSSDRPKLIEEMQTHMTGLGVRSTIADRAATVAEELLMNAIYDAPVGQDGKAVYAHLDRTNDVALKPEEHGEMRFACDGMLAAVSVSDPFGAFKIEILMNYLERNYAGKTDVQEAGKGGAGRGLHQIVENSDLVVFNVRAGFKTEVISFFNLDPKSKTESDQPTFHFFYE